jgi:hypothetical protein
MSEEIIRHGASPLKQVLSSEEIESRFGFHKAAIEGENVTRDEHRYLRRQFKMFAEMLSDTLGDSSREASLAFTALEEASMWAHKAIAKNAPLVDE